MDVTKKYFSDFTQTSYEKSEFLRLLEKRVRKHIRQIGPLDLSQSYVYLDDGSVLSQLLHYYMLVLFPKRLSLRGIHSLSELQTNDVLLESECLDTFITKQLNAYMKHITPHPRIGLMPLSVLTKQECEQVALLLDISGEIPSTHTFISDLEKEYVQTKMSFLKSYSHLQNLLN